MGAFALKISVINGTSSGVMYVSRTYSESVGIVISEGKPTSAFIERGSIVARDPIPVVIAEDDARFVSVNDDASIVEGSITRG